MIFVTFVSMFVFAECKGRFINPFTDVCWSCLFPITISSASINWGHQDYEKYNKIICACPGLPPTIGIPITFWEPTRLVDVTRTPYCLVGLGGIGIGSNTVKKHGTVGTINDTKYSFYQVHWYIYPLLYWLELLTDFTCIEKSQLDVGYITEFDPFWNDDEWSYVMNAEAGLFSSPVPQLACQADCLNSSFRTPTNQLFWCAGCLGSLYPLNGTVAHHVGAVQASSLLLTRIIAKFHKFMMMQGYDADDFCTGRFAPFLEKTLYKYQMVYPVNSECVALGKSDLLWGVGKSFPYGGEDFCYLVWKKRKCCLGATMLMTSLTGMPSL